MLHKFRDAKQMEIDSLHKTFSEGHIPAVYREKRPSFIEAIKSKGAGAIIAEFKLASPNKGILRTDVSPLDFAEMYQENGAVAMSVFTEHKYFGGTPDFLFMMQREGFPILRNDFILDPLQIAMTASSPAAAVMLTACLCDDALHLQQMIEIARMPGLEPVVQIYNQADLERARQAGANLIQVNNHDPETYEVIGNRAQQCILEKDPSEMWFCTGGISKREQVDELAALGFDAIFVGTSLMEAENPAEKLAELTAI